ncbi:YheC/YheD family protein [Paenibacillus sp. OAS669]|uniref:YheC/YheD family endospore coat-associated protein n=1 Tax=Paenibacillus sp. OAS669 TaxID=2663821 RepID=UPI00178904EE|nr:YheC/YheD family protein [Paenibacillus sp. OAS669]MBE1441368.1 glutathione synthase/RimK-type ligase-like ATP-grasp enzyme [Paenibacillus sp. OAS669]
MKRTKVKVQIQSSGVSSEGSTIKLSEAIAKKWKIPFHTPLKLCFGMDRQEVTVVPSSKVGVLQVSESLASRWNLPINESLCLRYKTKARTLHIGPLIGVMVSRVFTDNPDKPFGVNTAFCRELTETCKKYGAAVFFCTPKDMLGESDTIRGWRFTNKWVKSSYPLPNVIYNRLTSRKTENLANVQQFIKHVKAQKDLVFFNDKYLNKMEVFDALKKEQGLNAFLPESHLLRNVSILKTMCGKYPVVFLKPVGGSLGKGIIRVNRSSGESFACYYTGKSGVRKKTFSSLEDLYASITQKKKATRYQIQQGISLLTVNDRPVDFRALVQRGETGNWGVTSIVARIAGDHHYVSNLARGGSLSTVKDALARSGNPNASSGNLKLRRAAVKIAKGIEAQVPGHFAELGIDLALDSQGRVWLIEVNSKPSKDDNAPLSVEGKIRPSVRKFVQYARFAAKF